MALAAANILEMPQAVLGDLAVCLGTCLFSDIVRMSPFFLWLRADPTRAKDLYELSKNY